MDDEPGVRVCDGAHDLEEELEPGTDGQLSSLDVLVDRTPFDVLQREIRLPALRYAGVVQPGDVRVVEGGQDVSLSRHPVGEAGPHPRGAWQLERDGAIQHPIRTFGEPDGTHPAFGQFTENSVGSNRVRYRKTARRRPPACRPRRPWESSEGRPCSRPRASRTRGVAGAAGARRGWPAIRRSSAERGVWQLDRLVQQTAQDGPFLEAHIEIGHRVPTRARAGPYRTRCAGCPREGASGPASSDRRRWPRTARRRPRDRPAERDGSAGSGRGRVHGVHGHQRRHRRPANAVTMETRDSRGRWPVLARGLARNEAPRTLPLITDKRRLMLLSITKGNA